MKPIRGATRCGRRRDLTVAEIDGLERDLDKLGTPPDNCFRRMIAEIRRRRRAAKAAKRRRNHDDRAP